MSSSGLAPLIPPLRFALVSAIGPTQQQADSRPTEAAASAAGEGGGDVDDGVAGAPNVAGSWSLRPLDACRGQRRRRAQLAASVYRGAYPKPRNLKFLSRLCLRTILSLTPKPPADIGPGPSKTDGSKAGTEAAALDEFNTWANTRGIQLIHIAVPSVKNRSPTALPVEDARHVLSIMTDPANLPLYIHCLDGVEVTGLCVALYRKTQRWHRRAIFEEYCRHLRDPTPAPPAEVRTYIDSFVVDPRPTPGDDDDEEEEMDEEDEEEEDDEEDEDADDALEALDLEGY